VRDGYRADGDWRKYTKAFLMHLKTQTDSIGKLTEMVESSTCALLRFEADSSFCHRSIMADAASERCGAEIRHIVRLQHHGDEPCLVAKR